MRRDDEATTEGIDVDDGLEIRAIRFSIVLTPEQWKRFERMGHKPRHWAFDDDLSWNPGERRVDFSINIDDIAKSVPRAFEFAREFAAKLRQQ
jgi:hypothetical protein